MFTLGTNIVIFGSKLMNTGCYSLMLDLGDKQHGRWVEISYYLRGAK